MATTLTGCFETRRAAEMSIERLAQEFGVDRAAVLVAASGTGNTAGTQESGSDKAATERTLESRSDAALNGAIMVSVDLGDDANAVEVRSAFAAFDAGSVDEA